jgi:hypothetical protein
MSDGTAFAIDMLGWQLHRQYMDQQLGIQRDYAVLSQQYEQLLTLHNRLVTDYNNLLKTANRNQEAATRDRHEAATRIVGLERLLTEAEASAEHWRHKWADLMSKKAQS